jgi:hypothetical protein
VRDSDDVVGVFAGFATGTKPCLEVGELAVEGLRIRG